jgi:hypothetical protein
LLTKKIFELNNRTGQFKYTPKPHTIPAKPLKTIEPEITRRTFQQATQPKATHQSQPAAF